MREREREREMSHIHQRGARQRDRQTDRQTEKSVSMYNYKKGRKPTIAWSQIRERKERTEIQSGESNFLLLRLPPRLDKERGGREGGGGGYKK